MRGETVPQVAVVGPEISKTAGEIATERRRQVLPPFGHERHKAVALISVAPPGPDVQKLVAVINHRDNVVGPSEKKHAGERCRTPLVQVRTNGMKVGS